MRKCMKCGSRLPFFWGWEVICPQCGVRYPSIRSLVYLLVLIVAILIFHILVSFVYDSSPDIWDALQIWIWGFLAIFLMMHIVVLRRRRRGSAPANSPLIESEP